VPWGSPNQTAEELLKIYSQRVAEISKRSGRGWALSPGKLCSGMRLSLVF